MWHICVSEGRKNIVFVCFLCDDVIIVVGFSWKMEPAIQKRFSNLSTEEINQMVDHKDAESTQKATKTAFAMVIAFCKESTLGGISQTLAI